MIRRSAPRAPPEVAFTVDERLVLTKISQQWRKPLSQQSRLPEYLICLARLGGYLARAHDPPPGNLVVWRGMRRLRSEEHTSELQSLMRISYAVFCLKKKNIQTSQHSK